MTQRPPSPADGMRWISEGVPPRRRIPEIDGLAFDDLPDLRRAWIREISFAIPCREAVAAIAGRPLVEIGAGTGYWSALAARAGADVLATDAWPRSRYQQRIGHHHPVTEMTAIDAVLAHSDRDVLCVWPELNRPWCAEAAEAMAPGALLHLVGEPEGGCTGDERLFEVLARRFTRIRAVAIPTWPGQHDGLETFRKDHA